jgi:methyl-accepting chemotaxis protein
VLQAADQWRFVARSAAFGEGADRLPAARAAFDQALARLREQHAALGERLGADAAWASVEQSLAQVKGKESGSPDEIYQAMTGLSSELTDLLDTVVDHSGLALDPEMASYYLMSGTLMRAPQIIRRTGELRGLTGGALRAGRIEPAQTQRLVELRTLLVDLLEHAREEMDKASKAAGDLRSGLMLKTFGQTMNYVKAVDAQFPPGQTEVSGDAKALIALANEALTVQHEQVMVNLEVLDQLLAQREHRLQAELWFALAVTALSLLLALFLAMGFYRSMFGGFKALRRHLMAISMGDLRTEIALSIRPGQTGEGNQ